MLPPSPEARAALVVAHPSHELRVLGWLEKANPRVFILTDGSGRSGQSRLAATSRVLDRVGAEPGSIYGRITDLELYAATLRQDFDFFITLCDELADSLVRERIDYVVGDAIEGYSSAHDICRLLINAAVDLASRRDNQYISNFDFLVVGPPDECSETVADEAIWVHLDNDMFLRKIEIAHDYSPKLAADIDASLRGEKFQGIRRFFEPQIAAQADMEFGQAIVTALEARPELEPEIKNVLGGVELDAFRIECLRPVREHSATVDGMEAYPFYEIYGEKLVAAGRYQQVIRYRDHIRPLAQALRDHVEEGV